MSSTILSMNLDYDDRFNKNYFKNLSHDLLNDREFIKKALNYEPVLLEFLPNDMKDDEELVAIALNKDSYAYEFISDSLKTNANFIIPFIKLHPLLIEFAELNIRSNRELILELIESIGVYALFNASPSIIHDVEIITKAIKSEFSNEETWDFVLTTYGEDFVNSKKIIEKAYLTIGDKVLNFNFNELSEKYN